MDSTLRFRRDLARRVLRAVSASTLVAVAAHVAACGTVAPVGVGGSTGADMTTACFAWPGTGGAGGSTSKPDAGVAPCPSAADAKSRLTIGCGVMSVDSAGTLENGQCCYTVTTPACLTGRPFLVEDRPRFAPLRATAGWSRYLAPRLDDLSLGAREALAHAWSSDARGEHASIASFARFALDLLAVGAPADLVAAAQSAGLDEVRHAEMCFGLASAYAGRALAPGPFPFGGGVIVAGDLPALATMAVKEGCVGETLAALQAAEQLASASDPAVRSALRVIAGDEARHAELAWRSVAWAIAEGGEPVARAVRAAFAEALAAPPSPPAIPVEHERELAPHGRLGTGALARAFQRGIADVIAPAARRLLGVAEAPADRPRSHRATVGAA
jgi:hypothetical protein